MKRIILLIALVLLLGGCTTRWCGGHGDFSQQEYDCQIDSLSAGQHKAMFTQYIYEQCTERHGYYKCNKDGEPTWW